jgi:hypothetical protein
MVVLLLSMGADINQRDKDGCSAGEGFDTIISEAFTINY